MEIWKDIKGYEGLYQISNYGRVKSLGNGNSNNSKERILKPAKLKDGYLYVILSKQGKRKGFKIHRLVAQAFIENPNNYPQVNHKDEDKTNNNVSNLEFCTPKYNINYGTAIQRRVENTDYKAIAAKIDYTVISAKRTAKISKQVLCVETGKIYSSIHQVERELGFDGSCISKCCRGKLTTMYGYHWEYVV